MTLRLLLSLVLIAATSAASGVRAQSVRSPLDSSDRTVLPILNNSNGKVEAFLLLEPSTKPAAGARWRAGETSLDAAFGLGAGDTLGLVCNRQSGLANAIGNLVNHCMLAALEQDGKTNRQGAIGVGLSRAAGRVGLSWSAARETLPAWLTSSGRASRVDQNTLTVYGQRNIGSEATVSIAGTWARATLIPAGQAPGLADRWSTRTLTVGTDIGSFGANVIGRVVDTPNAPGQWEGLGVGLTWRTPWSGQLTVGAENVVTRGRNPFAPHGNDPDEGTVPYVRYEQDL